MYNQTKGREYKLIITEARTLYVIENHKKNTTKPTEIPKVDLLGQ